MIRNRIRNLEHIDYKESAEELAMVAKASFPPTNIVDGISFLPDKMLQGR